MVVDAAEDSEAWLQFASLCRRAGRLNMSARILDGLGMNGESAGDAIAAAGSQGLSRSASHVPPPEDRSGPGGVAMLSVVADMLAAFRGAPPGQPPPLPGSLFLAGSLSPIATLPALPLPGGTQAGTTPGIVGRGGSGQTPFGAVPELLSTPRAAVVAAHPTVVYAYLKQLWSSGHGDAAASQMRTLAAALDDRAALRARAAAATAAAAAAGTALSDAEAAADAAVGVFGGIASRRRRRQRCACSATCGTASGCRSSRSRCSQTSRAAQRGPPPPRSTWRAAFPSLAAPAATRPRARISACRTWRCCGAAQWSLGQGCAGPCRRLQQQQPLRPVPAAAAGPAGF